MKAVYEMPNVHFEEFSANNAIAACGIDSDVIFDCLKGPDTDTVNVLSSAINITNCSNNAGFADYVTVSGDNLAGNDTEILTDNITESAVSSYNNHSNYSEYLQWDKKTNSVDIKSDYKNSFLGWLYISGNDKDKNMNTSGWSLSDGKLKFDPNSCKKDHGMLAPVFNLVIGTSM